MVKPRAHLKDVMKHEEQVLEVLLDCQKYLEKKYPIKLGLVVFNTPNEDVQAFTDREGG